MEETVNSPPPEADEEKGNGSTGKKDAKHDDYHHGVDTGLKTGQSGQDRDVKRKSSNYETFPTFTRALFRAIEYSGTTQWVLGSDGCPNTPVWNEWLRQVDEQLTHPTPGWDCQQALTQIIIDLKEKTLT